MSNTTVRTPEFRLAFPHLFVPHKANATADEKFSVCALFAPGTNLDEMAAAVNQAAFDKWGNDLPANLKTPWRRGESKLDKKGNRMVGFDDGVIFITASTKQRPGVVDENVQGIMDQGVIYGGCYCHATVNAFTYDVSGNIGVSFGLNNIQKLRDGDPFSARTSPDEDFTPVAVTPGVAGQAPGLSLPGPAAGPAAGIALPSTTPS